MTTEQQDQDSGFNPRAIAVRAAADGEDAVATVINQLVGYASTCWEYFSRELPDPPHVWEGAEGECGCVDGLWSPACVRRVACGGVFESELARDAAVAVVEFVRSVRMVESVPPGARLVLGFDQGLPIDVGVSMQADLQRWLNGEHEGSVAVLAGVSFAVVVPDGQEMEVALEAPQE